MSFKTVYRYNTKCIYVGETVAQEDPLNAGNFLMPENTTQIQPIAVAEGYVAVWNGNEWEAKEDHRRHLDETGHYVGGTPYWLPSEGDDWQSEPRYMTEVGPLPEGSVTVKPSKPQSLIDKEALEQTIAEAKAFLDSTDYAVIKCAEQGLDLEITYPGLKTQRQEKRDLINQCEVQALSLDV